MRLARKLKKDPLYFCLSPEGSLNFPPCSYLWPCHSCYMKRAIINHLSASQITQWDRGSSLTPVLLLFSSDLSGAVPLRATTGTGGIAVPQDPTEIIQNNICNSSSVMFLSARLTTSSELVLRSFGV